MVGRRSWLLGLLSLSFSSRCWPYSDETADYRVSHDHPRLFLPPRRLKLLRREQERQSMRWAQFDRLITGKGRLPEPGFSGALYYQITGSPDAARQAVEWALGPAKDLRQTALVFDWCQQVLSPDESRRLVEKLGTGLAGHEENTAVAAVRDRVLCAVALSGHVPDSPERQLQSAVNGWWREGIIAAVRQGKDPIRLDDHLPLFEMFHAIRDNLQMDLRSDAPAYFKALPILHIMSHYPAPLQAADGEYRIPARLGAGEPNLERAAVSRIAGFAMVAYDTNLLENQFLQGWLIQDRFLLYSAFGAPYEFLWANPYQPGLAVETLPQIFHEEHHSGIFARSSWDDDARWMGYFGGEFQVMEEGTVRIVRPGTSLTPIPIGAVTALFGRSPMRLSIDGKETSAVIVLGLKPSQTYQVEVDDEELREENTDVYGVLDLRFQRQQNFGIRLRTSA